MPSSWTGFTRNLQFSSVLFCERVTAIRLGLRAGPQAGHGKVQAAPAQGKCPARPQRERRGCHADAGPAVPRCEHAAAAVPPQRRSSWVCARTPVRNVIFQGFGALSPHGRRVRHGSGRSGFGLLRRVARVRVYLPGVHARTRRHERRPGADGPRRAVSGRNECKPWRGRNPCRGVSRHPAAALLSRMGQWRQSPFAAMRTLGNTLYWGKEEVAGMFRFTRNNGITEGFHRKMKLIQRRAYGFRNFENYRLRVRVLCG